MNQTIAIPENESAVKTWVREMNRPCDDPSFGIVMRGLGNWACTKKAFDKRWRPIGLAGFRTRRQLINAMAKAGLPVPA